jgi:demethylmenaquinone methyltransferase/2-methoxy-6-polyprenyl-1,4-benzoquinol methylase
LTDDSRRAYIEHERPCAEAMSEGVQRLFPEVARNYELVNHAMTLGLDILWRRKAARVAANEGGGMWLDVCTGTGEMAVYLGRLAKRETAVMATDFSPPMIRKATKKRGVREIAFVLTDAKSLPFADNTFDLVTTSFATRNLNVNRRGLIESFREFHRILKPGGRYVSLETSQPPSWLVRKLFHLYVRLTVRPLGYAISRSRAAYAYLSHTLQYFYTADELADVMQEAGFAQVSFQRLTLGAAAIHKAIKSG